MSNFDIGFAVISLGVALFVIIRYPLYRAIVRECVFHPRSEGWIDVDAEGKVQVYRGDSLSDYVMKEGLEALKKVEEGERKASQLSSPSSEGANWQSYAKAAAAAGIGFLSAYLLHRKNGSSEGEN